MNRAEFECAKCHDRPKFMPQLPRSCGSKLLSLVYTCGSGRVVASMACQELSSFKTQFGQQLQDCVTKHIDL